MRESYLNKICTWTVLGNSGAFVLISGKIIESKTLQHILIPGAWMFILGLLFAVLFNFLTLLELQMNEMDGNSGYVRGITILSAFSGGLSASLFFLGCIIPLYEVSKNFQFLHS